ncbi:MAG: L,D-transpeptidase family protein [Nevskiales bacterium]
MSEERPSNYLEIDIAAQNLTVWQDGARTRQYSVSTALKGPGELIGSEQTPRGWHKIRAKIGAGVASGTVFRGRRAAGAVWTPALAAQHPGRDWILSRILWLSGLEPGRNRLGKVDSMRRYIYVHGCPDTEPLAVPRSHGCVRMRNDQVIELFDAVPVGMRVWLHE